VDYFLYSVESGGRKPGSERNSPACTAAERMSVPFTI